MRALTLSRSTRWLASIFLTLSLVLVGIAWYGSPPAKADDGKLGAAKGLGQLSGLLPQSKLVLESALQVDLTQETVRLPLYKGTANGHTVWFILTEASDLGLAKNSGLNYAPKLANIAVSCAACVQTPDADPRPGTKRVPPGKLLARRSCWPGLQPIHPDRRQHCRL